MYFYLEPQAADSVEQAAPSLLQACHDSSPPRNCSDGGGGWTLRISACGGSVWLRVRKLNTVLLLDMSVDPNVCVKSIYVLLHIYVLCIYTNTHANIRVYLCLCGTFRQCQ